MTMTQHTTMIDRDLVVKRLLAENEELHEQVRQLKQVLTPPFIAPYEWHLTRYETQILSSLLSAKFISKERLFVSLYSDDNDPPSDNNVKVLVSRLRKKLLPFGVVIKFVWGQGFFLEDLEQWRSRLLVTNNKPQQSNSSQHPTTKSRTANIQTIEGVMQ